MSASLLNRKVIIAVNEHLPENLHASVAYVDEGARAVLLHLSSAALISNVEYQYAVAKPRQDGESMQALITKKRLSCNVTLVPTACLNEKSPVDVSWWRGGGAMVADVYVLGEESVRGT